MSTDLSLVPPRRFGALLTSRRTALGLTIEELLVGDGAPGFSTEELRRIEQGNLALDDGQIARLVRLYRADAGSVVPERSELVVDLDAGAVAAAGTTEPLPPGAGVDEVLARYLSLLYLLRGLEPGRPLTLRSADLDVLAAALERSVSSLEARLAELMLTDEVDSWFSRLRHRVAVPAAGLLVGLSAVGGLLLIRFPSGERPALGEPVIGIGAPAQIGDPLAVGASGATWTPGDPASVGAAALSTIDFPVPTLLPGWTIEFEGPRDGYRGNTNTVTRVITVHVGPDDEPFEVAGVLAHELGHAFDVMYLDDVTRDAWRLARGIDGPWWPRSGAADFHVGAGDFAEAFAALTAQSPSDSAYGGFDPTQLETVRSLIVAAV